MTSIRLAKVHDAEQIASIYNHYIQHSISTFETRSITADEVRQRLEQVQRNDLPWLVAENNEQVIAYCYASPFHPRAGYRHSVEITVYVKDGQQHQGLGSELYHTLFGQLSRESIHMLIACISLPNDGSVALHEKLGMKKTAHFSEVGRKFDRWIDVGYWQMPLSQIKPD